MELPRISTPALCRPPESADWIFDRPIEHRWRQHLSSLLENVTITKRWKSGNWHKLLEGVELFNDSEYDQKAQDHVDPDMLVAEDEDEENLNYIPEVEASELVFDDHDPIWSVAGSPPFTEDARRELPALHEQDQQGGNSEAEPFLWEAPSWTADFAEQWYLPGVLQRDCEKFEYVYDLEPGSSTSKAIDTCSALTVAG